GLLELADQRREILVALRDLLVERLLEALLVHGLPRFLGEAFAVGRLVVDDGDLLALVFRGEELAGDTALHVGTASDVEHVAAALRGRILRELRIAGRGSDLQDARLGVGSRGLDRRA